MRRWLSTAVAGGCLAVFGWWLLTRWRGALRGAIADERWRQIDAQRRFIRRLNHGLNNRLTVLQAGLANIDGADEDRRSAQASLSNVRQQVERLEGLGKDLARLANLGASRVQRAPVDLGAVIEEAAEMAHLASGRDGRKVEVRLHSLPQPSNLVQGDSDLLSLAIYHLLDNALKFSQPDGTVEIRASTARTRATIEVVDTGPGIAPEDLPYVTEPLYQGQGTHQNQGRGLGLTLVERIVAFHDGELSITNRQPQGTMVTVRLPLRHSK